LSSEQTNEQAAPKPEGGGDNKASESKGGDTKGGAGGGGRGGRGGGRDGGRGGRGGGRDGGRGRGRGRGRGGDDRVEKLIENVVRINRSAAVVKGGRRFSFSALVVVGDGKGRVGVGYGKANGVPNAVEKGVKEAKKNMFRVPLVDGSIPHSTKARYQASKVILEPASPGTGLIAGASVRAVCEAAGIRNILTKCHGSGNPINVVKAVEAGLRQMRTRKDVEALRGVKLDPEAGSWKIKQKKKAKGGGKKKKAAEPAKASAE